jgi:hypothetical protein
MFSDPHVGIETVRAVGVAVLCDNDPERIFIDRYGIGWFHDVPLYERIG